jgi:hypothetical protein
MEYALDATCVDETGEDGIYAVEDFFFFFFFVIIVESKDFGVVIRGGCEDGEEQNSLVSSYWPAVR